MRSNEQEENAAKLGGSELATLSVRYWQSLKAKQYSSSTLKITKRALGYFTAWCSEQEVHRVGQLRRDLLWKYCCHIYEKRNEMTGELLDDSSQYDYLGYVRQFLRWLYRQNMVISDLAEYIQVRKRKMRLPRQVLTVQEVQEILGSVELCTPLGLRDRAMLETLYATGMRRSELAGLKMRDLDLEQQVVLIIEGKGKKDRLIPLGERAALWLGKYIREARGELTTNKGEQSVFINCFGRALTDGGISARLARYVRQVRGKGSCHLLRHAMATHMLANGADTRFIQEMLGHESLDATQVYTHLDIKRLQDVHSQTHPASKQTSLPELSLVKYTRKGGQRHTSRGSTWLKMWQKPIGATEGLRRYAKQYIQSLQAQGYARATLDNYRHHLRDFINWCNERAIRELEGLMPRVVESYQNHLSHTLTRQGRPYSSGYRYRHISSVKQFLLWLEHEGVIVGKLSHALELPRVPKRIPRDILTVQEVQRILEAVDIGKHLGVRDRAILETLYSTGMRGQELRNLRQEHIQEQSGTVLVVQGKGGRDRLIPIGTTALQWIKLYREQVRPCLTQDEAQTVLFLSLYGQPLSKKGLETIANTYIRAANINKGGSCHVFRHSMATHMLENGADIRYIQEMLGHAVLSTTQIYTKVSIRKLKEIHTRTHPTSQLRPAGKKFPAQE